MLRCIACNASFVSDNALVEHWKSNHPSLYTLHRNIEQEMSQRNELPYCSKCDIVFPNMQVWAMHVKSRVCASSQDGPLPDEQGRYTTSKHTKVRPVSKILEFASALSHVRTYTSMLGRKSRRSYDKM